MAKLVKVGSRWHFLTNWSERNLVPRKGNGHAYMQWNRLPESPKVWSTDIARVAAMVAEFADDETRADIIALAGKEPEPDVATLLFDGATYRYYSGFEQKDAARDAGFTFTREPSPAHWWTQDPDAAVRCYQAASQFEGFTCPAHIQAVLQAHLEATQAHIEASRVVGLDIDLPRPAGLDYLPFQRAGIVYGMQRRNVLFGDEMGLGKTIEALGLVNALGLRSVLVVCPATLKRNWCLEAEKWLVGGQRVGIADSKQVPFGADVVIINFESLHSRAKSTDCFGCKHPALAHVGKGIYLCVSGGTPGTACACVQFVETPSGDPVLRADLDREWDLLIVDECHRVKSKTAIRSKMVFAIRSKRSAFLSGTPLPNRPKELWTLLNYLAPEVFSKEWDFYKRFCGASRANSFSKDGASNLDELQAKMRASCFLGDTQVSSEYGQVAIQELVKRRLRLNVWCRDSVGRLALRPIVGFSERAYRGLLVKIRFSEGEFICTPDHRIFIDQGEKRAGEIVAGDYLWTLPQAQGQGITSQRSVETPFGQPDILLNEVCGQEPDGRSEAGLQGVEALAAKTIAENLRRLPDCVLRAQRAPLLASPFLHVLVPRANSLRHVVSSPELGFEQIQSEGHQGDAISAEAQTRKAGSDQGRNATASITANKEVAGQAARAGASRARGGTVDPGGWSGRSARDQRSPDLRGHLDTGDPSGDRGGRRGSRQESPAQARQGARLGFARSRVLSVEVLGVGDRGYPSGSGREGFFVYDIEVDGAHNYFANNALVHNCMVRRLKAEVLPELPAKRRQVLEFPVGALSRFVSAEQDAWQRREDLRLELRTQVELSKASDDPEDHKRAVAALKEGMKVAFSEIAKLRHDTAVAKIPLVIQHIENVLESESKYVIFCHHIDVIEALVKHFGRSAVAVYGAVSEADRIARKDRFNDDPTCRLFIGGIFVAGVGLSLRCSKLGFAELDWVPGNVSQCEDRCHGVGRGVEGEPLLVQHLMLEGSLDAQMARTVVAKQDIADRALDLRAEVSAEPLDEAFEFEPEAVVLGEKREAIAPADVSELPSTHGATPEWIVKTAEKLSADDVVLIYAAVRRLAGLCDGAASRDSTGFNRYDTALGHSLAVQGSLSQKSAALALRLCKKYNSTQLGGMLDSLYERPE